MSAESLGRTHLILCTPLTSDGIQFIDEDNRGRLGSGGGEEFPDTFG